MHTLVPWREAQVTEELPGRLPSGRVENRPNSNYGSVLSLAAAPAKGGPGGRFLRSRRAQPHQDAPRDRAKWISRDLEPWGQTLPPSLLALLGVHLPRGRDQFLEKSVHYGVEELHPGDRRVDWHGSRR